MKDPRAVFVIEALMEALDNLKAVINDESGTPEEAAYRINEALRIAHEYLD